MTIRKAERNEVTLLANFQRALDNYNYSTLGLRDLFYGLNPGDQGAYESMMRNYVADENNVFYIAEEETETQPVGFALLILEPNKFGDNRLYALLDFIFVDPDFQRKGVGQAIFNTIVAELKILGAVGLSSQVFENNQISLNFHEKNGFRIIATSHELYKPLT
ncbi:diamine N-acetyltransferase [Patescibacteria group bacterium]|nr:GNAT family N-acetyltransferase [Candidatus Dojkabacteria bacterium]CAG1020117.1 diamine N-acetyltransferase [Patescibacteria group bacterium]